MPKAPSKPKHQPIPELVKALAMPDEKRAGGRNAHSRIRRETAADYIAAIKAAGHTR